MEDETQKADNKAMSFSDLDEDVDIDVMTEVQHKTEDLALEKTEPVPLLSEKSEIEKSTDIAHERSASWSGFFKKKLGSLKGETADKASPTEQKKRDWTKEQEALTKFKTTAVRQGTFNIATPKRIHALVL